MFRGLAAIGKTTMGWFYGFKLHLICDVEGNLCDCFITSGNVDDRKYVEKMSKNIKGKNIWRKGIHLAKTRRVPAATRAPSHHAPAFQQEEPSHALAG